MPLTRIWAKSSYSDPNGGNCVEARQPGARHRPGPRQQGPRRPCAVCQQSLLARVHRRRPGLRPGRLATPAAWLLVRAPEPAQP